MAAPPELAGLQYRLHSLATASGVAAVAGTVAAAFVDAAYTAVAYWPSVAAQMPLLVYAVLAVAVA